MAVKPNNIITFRSEVYNTYVYLVRRSLGKYQTKENRENGSPMTYYKGQLAKDWQVIDPETGATFVYGKGQVVWFNAAFFIGVYVIPVK